MVIHDLLSRKNSFGPFLNYTLGNKRNASSETVTNQSQNSSKNLTTMNRSIKKNRNQCSFCDSQALYRCNKCHLYLSCSSPSIHFKEWQHHELHCPKIISKTNSNSLLDSEAKQNEKNDMQKTIIFKDTPKSQINQNQGENDHKEFNHFFNSEYAMQRQEIFLMFKENKIKSALLLLNNVVSDSFQQISIKRNTKQIISFDQIESNTSLSIEDILVSFQHYFEYFTDLLLLIHLYAKLQAKDKLWRTLNHLKREMEIYNYSYIIELIIEYYHNLTNQFFKKNIIIKCEEIFLGVLKYSIALARYSYCLGEFAYYEQFLFDFIENMQNICHNNNCLLSNMYLLLGNLYLKYNILKKAEILYKAIIDNNNSLADINSNMFQVVLCANYNLGVIYFTIGKYDQCKQRMEIAIKIKQDFLKEKYDIQMARLYLTLTEIEVEFNNYSSAYIYLQKASQVKEFLSEIDTDTNDEFNRTFVIKENLLKEFILQNSNEDTLMNNELKSNFMLKHFGVLNNKPVNLQYKLIQDVIKDDPPKLKEIIPLKQLNQFFLFMTQLSKSQIKRLNDDQPKDLEANKRLSIVFSSEFKSSLSQVQSLALSELEVISLTRVNVLRNYLGKIKIKNLNYNVLYVSPEENNLTIIQNGYLAKTILKTWEVSPEAKKELTIPQNAFVINKELPIQKSVESSDHRKKSIKAKDQPVLNNIFNDNYMIDYDKLRLGFKNYCRENAPEKETFVTEEFILLIGQEMKREELIKICTCQELIPILIDSFLSINNEKIAKKAKREKRNSVFLFSINAKSSNDIDKQ